MIRSKYFGLAAVAFAMLSLGACTTDSDSSVPTIDGLYMDNTTLTAGGTATAIHTTVSGDAGFQVLFSIQDVSGKDASSYFTLNQGTGPKSTDTKWQSIDNGSTIAAKSTAVNGTYTLTLTVTSSSGNNTKTATFTVTGGTTATTTPLTNQGVVSLGAQSASAGSFLDVANYTAYTSGMDKPYATIDVVFGADAAGAASLLSPFAASTDGFTALASWPTLNKTIIVGPLSSAISTQEAAMAAIGSATTQKVAATSGLYALKLGSSGKYAALKLTVAGSGKTATADVTVYN